MERPIPSGAISSAGVWGWGLGWLLGGWLLLTLLGAKPAYVGLILVGAILLYDAIHKAVTLSPLLMALCRFLLYLLAGAATRHGVSGSTVWSGLALALYVVGLSCIARKESARGPLQFWPPWLLAAPLSAGVGGQRRRLSDSSRGSGGPIGGLDRVLPAQQLLGGNSEHRPDRLGPPRRHLPGRPLGGRGGPSVGHDCIPGLLGTRPAGAEIRSGYVRRIALSGTPVWEFATAPRLRRIAGEALF